MASETASLPGVFLIQFLEKKNNAQIRVYLHSGPTPLGLEASAARTEVEIVLRSTNALAATILTQFRDSVCRQAVFYECQYI